MPEHDEDAATIDGCAAGGVGLLIIDMINDLGFDGGARIEGAAEAAAEVVLALRAEADQLGVPVVYVNDNYGAWHSERSKIVAACGAPDKRGRRLVEMMAPREGDFFVIKPQFSGFYATNLPVLLPKLGVTRLVLTGLSADICVLFTAADAHMRAYQLWAPRDAVASEDDERAKWALSIMQRSMGAETRGASDLSLRDWVAAPAQCESA